MIDDTHGRTRLGEFGWTLTKGFAMPTCVTERGTRDDLDGVWPADQLARIRQRYLQAGRHFRLDIGSLLRRARGAEPVIGSGRFTDTVEAIPA